ncbi:MAG: hypothetical protein CL947_00785 [Epsilonproteobacteria bacterium]|nr:hypothetical protein [Campylobacterota bacterium]
MNKLYICLVLSLMFHSDNIFSMEHETEVKKESTCCYVMKGVAAVGILATMTLGLVVSEKLYNQSYVDDELSRSKHCLCTGYYPKDNTIDVKQCDDQCHSDVSRLCLQDKPSSIWKDLLYSNEEQVRRNVRRRMHRHAAACLSQYDIASRQTLQVQCVHYAVEQTDSDFNKYLDFIKIMPFLNAVEDNK